MIIKTTSLAFAAVCLMTVWAMPAAHAQSAGGPQVVTNGPQTDTGDVSPSWSARQERDRQRTLRSATGNEPWLPRGADAQGVRSDYRSAAPRQLSGELQSGRTFDRFVAAAPELPERIRDAEMIRLAVEAAVTRGRRPPLVSGSLPAVILLKPAAWRAGSAPRHPSSTQRQQARFARQRGRSRPCRPSSRSVARWLPDRRAAQTGSRGYSCRHRSRKAVRRPRSAAREHSRAWRARRR